jgi:hypothetical protein
LQVRVLSGVPVGKDVVDVAQLVELWIVIPAVVGSSPIVHPNMVAASPVAGVVKEKQGR